MTREELLNEHKELVRDIVKESIHFQNELDAEFFDNWAEHLTNLAEKLCDIFPQGLDEAEEKVFEEWGTTKEEYLRKSMDKVHLEMEIATYLQDWSDTDEGVMLETDCGSIPIELDDIRDLARHFYELGKNAR